MTEKITEDANKIEIPESLQPDAVEKMLEQNKIGKQRRRDRTTKDIIYSGSSSLHLFCGWDNCRTERLADRGAGKRK